jgi:hypothetical protein
MYVSLVCLAPYKVIEKKKIAPGGLSELLHI